MPIFKKIIVLGCLIVCFNVSIFLAYSIENWEIDKKEVHALFVLSQEVNIHQIQLVQLKDQEVQINRQIKETNELVFQSKSKQEILLNRYANYLKNKQVKGQYYYLEQLIQANTLRKFLDKIYAFHILEKSTTRLHDEIVEETSLLELRNKELMAFNAQNQKLIEETELELANFVRKKEALDELLKKYEANQAFMRYFKDLEIRWKKIQPTFIDKINAFNLLISDQVLPESIFDIKVVNNKLHATLVEERFNKALKEQSIVSDMSFIFSTRGVEIYFETLKVKLFGDFILESPQKIVFEVKEGFFEDQMVSHMVIKYFLDQKNIQFDLSTMLGKSKIEKIKSQHKEVELIIQMRLF